MLFTEVVLRFSKIIVTSEVPVWSKGFFGDLEKISCDDAVGTVDESDELDAFLLLLEFKQAVDDVVSARGCVTKKKNTHFSSESLGS